jgi:ABC-type branched-subunit amino acid transport system ATPase component
MLALARVLAQDAELVLLDEPFAGLSQTTIAESIDIIRRLISQHKTIGVVDHNVEAMTRLVDYMVAVDHGRKITEGRQMRW